MKLKHFSLAKKLSKQSTHPKHQLGAVIIKGNTVLSIGFNKYKTSPRSNHPWAFIHAENSCLNSLDKSAVGADIYVYRETKSGMLANSKPCKYCYQMLKRAGIRRVYYTVDNGYMVENL